MYEEIDLREYIKVLIRNWTWIVGGALAAAVVAFIVSSLLPPTYEAVALVAVTRPRYVMQFDPRFETVDNIQPAYDAYPELATSSGLLKDLLARLDVSADELESLESLRDSVEAKSGGDPSLVRLVVRSREPEVAAYVANLWVEVFIEHANTLYGGQNGEQEAFIAQQLRETQTELEAAEQAIIDFEARNRSVVLESRLEAYGQAQLDYLETQKGITDLIRDIEGLRAQLAQRPAEETVSLSEQLTFLLLQSKAFNVNTEETVPFQIQIGEGTNLTEQNVAEQRSFLENLVDTLETRYAEIEERLEELEPQILTTQRQLSEVQTEEARLRRVRDVANETYLTLARKYEEVRIGAQDTTGEFLLASEAVTPEKPSGPRRMLNTVVAGGLGFFLTVLGVLILAYWEK